MARSSRRSRVARPFSGPAGILVGSVSGPLIALELHPAALVQAVWCATPSTRAEPLVVAPPQGRIVAVCPLAAMAGVTPGQTVAQARLRCPALTVRPPDDADANLLWETLLVTLSGVSPIVEAADSASGVAYLDAHGLNQLWGDAAAVARAALRALAAHGIGARAGAGPTRTVALALARRMGPAGPQLLGDDAARAFLHALPIDEPALGLPPAIVAVVQEMGITTAGRLAALPCTALGLRFGPDAIVAWQRAAGALEPPLSPWKAPDQLVVTQRMEAGIRDTMALDAVLAYLSHRLAGHLVVRGQAAATVTLSLDCEDGARQVGRAQHWPPVHTPQALMAALHALLARSPPPAPVEGITVYAADLCSPATQQAGLWDNRTALRQRERLTSALAAYTRRYGQGHLQRVRRDPLHDDGWTFDVLEPPS